MKKMFILASLALVGMACRKMTTTWVSTMEEETK